MSLELFFLALIAVGVFRLATGFVTWFSGEKKISPQQTHKQTTTNTPRGGHHSGGKTKKNAVKKKAATFTNNTTNNAVADATISSSTTSTTPSKMKPKKKSSLLDAPLFISPHNRRTRPRTFEEEQAYIASLQKSAGASEEEAREYVRRLTAFEKAKGCY
jgi:hypothetical protein